MGNRGYVHQCACRAAPSAQSMEKRISGVKNWPRSMSRRPGVHSVEPITWPGLRDEQAWARLWRHPTSLTALDERQKRHRLDKARMQVRWTSCHRCTRRQWLQAAFACPNCCRRGAASAVAARRGNEGLVQLAAAARLIGCPDRYRQPIHACLRHSPPRHTISEWPQQ
jgi:hypothetical protein